MTSFSFLKSGLNQRPGFPGLSFEKVRTKEDQGCALDWLF
jgi:hypothetical protein